MSAPCHTLGRPSFIKDAAGNKVQKAYRYGPKASYELTSNPYTATSDPTMGWTLTVRDPIGRPINVVNYKGAVPPAPWGNNTTPSGQVLTAYDQSDANCTGPVTRVTDEAGYQTTYCPDGLGRLTGVKEADGTLTQNSYDVLDNLTQVSVAGQVRAFEYSTLSRLTKACNPETGTAGCTSSPLPTSGLEQYTYDAVGNLKTRTDANSVVTTYSGYDGLNRPSSKTYSTAGTPAVTYGYDVDFKGALSAVNTTISGLAYGTSYAHDTLGRVKGSRQTTANQAYTFGYVYSLSDRLQQMTYPSGKIVKYVPDSAGRINAVQNGGTSGYWASQIAYTAAGGVSSMKLGNNITETVSWNDRLQVTGLTAGTNLTLNFYPCPGSVASCSSGNNDRIQSQSISLPGLATTQTYSYDLLNRLTNAAETGTGSWNEKYNYLDTQGKTYGNRWVDTSSRSGLQALTLETPQAASWYTGANQIGGWPGYSAGNVTGVGSMSRSFVYDAENRQTGATINGVLSSYVYDGDGQRVQKTAPLTVGNTVTATTTFVYDAWGELAAEYSTAPSDANRCPTPTCYVTVDHLGSTRMVTDSTGAVARRYDYLPFGQELQSGTGGRTAAMGYQNSPDNFNPKFTGQMRDQETGLDYFHARYYSPAQGRFQSADPANAGKDNESVDLEPLF